MKIWLDSLGLGQYYEQFQASGLTSLARCSGLSLRSLDGVNFNLPGHKKRVFREGNINYLENDSRNFKMLTGLAPMSDQDIIGDVTKKYINLGRYKLIRYQILPTEAIRLVWQTVMRMRNRS